MKPLRISKSDHGKEIEVTAGRKVVIELLENPTTGYRWQSRGRKAPSMESEFRLSAQAGVGGGGLRVFTLSFPDKGTFALCLELRREWEKDVDAIDRLEVRLTIR